MSFLDILWKIGAAIASGFIVTYLVWMCFECKLECYEPVSFGKKLLLFLIPFLLVMAILFKIK